MAMADVQMPTVPLDPSEVASNTLVWRSPPGSLSSGPTSTSGGGTFSPAVTEVPQAPSPSLSQLDVRSLDSDDDTDSGAYPDPSDETESPWAESTSYENVLNRIPVLGRTGGRSSDAGSVHGWRESVSDGPTNDNGPDELVNEAGEWRADEAVYSSLTDDGFRSYWVVVAIFGPEQSGKSTLMNRIWGTKLKTSGSTLQRTTEGIHCQRAKFVESKFEPFNLAVVDCEGADGTKRGEDQTFARRSLLWACQVSNLVIINFWDERSARLYNGGLKETLFWVLEAKANRAPPDEGKGKGNAVVDRVPVVAIVIRNYYKDDISWSEFVAEQEAQLQAEWTRQNVAGRPLSQVCKFEFVKIPDLFDSRCEGATELPMEALRDLPGSIIERDDDGKELNVYQSADSMLREFKNAWNHISRLGVDQAPPRHYVQADALRRDALNEAKKIASAAEKDLLKILADHPNPTARRRALRQLLMSRAADLIQVKDAFLSKSVVLHLREHHVELHQELVRDFQASLVDMVKAAFSRVADELARAMTASFTYPAGDTWTNYNDRIDQAELAEKQQWQEATARLRRLDPEGMLHPLAYAEAILLEGFPPKRQAAKQRFIELSLQVFKTTVKESFKVAVRPHVNTALHVETAAEQAAQAEAAKERAAREQAAREQAEKASTSEKQPEQDVAAGIQLSLVEAVLEAARSSVIEYRGLWMRFRRIQGEGFADVGSLYDQRALWCELRQCLNELVTLDAVRQKAAAIYAQALKIPNQSIDFEAIDRAANTATQQVDAIIWKMTIQIDMAQLPAELRDIVSNGGPLLTPRTAEDPARIDNFKRNAVTETVEHRKNHEEKSQAKSYRDKCANVNLAGGIAGGVGVAAAVGGSVVAAPVAVVGAGVLLIVGASAGWGVGRAGLKGHQWWTNEDRKKKARNFSQEGKPNY